MMSSTAQPPAARMQRAREQMLAAIPDSQIKLPARFKFRWRGRDFLAVADRRDADCMIAIFGILGHVPYSAADRSRRLHLMDLLKAGRSSGRCEGMRLEGGDLVLRRARHIPPPSYAEFIAASVAILADLDGALEVFGPSLSPA